MGRFFTFLLLYLSAQACFSQNWVIDFLAAKERAQKIEKPILLVFSGSDWCVPCIKLERNIWKSESFKTYALENLVLYRADFPRKKKNQLPEQVSTTNKILAEKYNSEGYFPHVVLLRPSGKVMGRLGYEKVGPEEYIKKIDSLNK